MTGYATMLQNGIANQDEIRDLEDWNPIADGIGTGYHIQLNMQTLPPDGGPLQPPKGPPGGATHRRTAKPPAEEPAPKPNEASADTGVVDNA